LNDAGDFLKNILSDGPIPSSEIFEKGRNIGFSDSTIRRAQKSLNIKAERKSGIGAEGNWQWTLPES
jgi:putative DNA primase/helicase